MENCIFCKIATHAIPTHIVYEDSEFIAFLDIMPRNKGHTLVIPKTHYRWVWDVPDGGEYFKVAKKIALAQKKAFSTDWVVSLILGEEIPHAHIWLVPRFPEDGHGGSINLDNCKKFTTEEMEKFQEMIRNEL